MCRLALMNRAAIFLLDTELAALFARLERSMGGDGNGLAALWSETGAVKIHKGLTITTAQAAAKAAAYADGGADWVLFHTRLATSGERTSRSCHPFKSGQLVMAHNGHSHVWHMLGASIGISDSECITRMWSRLRLPLASLEDVEGVFLGFHSGSPFVVKGRFYDDLTVSLHEETGAVLFASELDWPFCRLFDHTVEAGRLHWSGEPLNIWKIEPRLRPIPKYTQYLTVPISTTGALTSGESQPAVESTDDKKPSSSITLADLQAWYQRIEHETNRTSDDTADSEPEDIGATSSLQSESE